MPVRLQRVSVQDVKSLCSAFRFPRCEFSSQPPIFLYPYHPQPGGEQALREAPPPRPDLEHDVVGRGVERVDDFLENGAIGEEVLAESLVGNHALRMTTVRSSVGGAPPVKPARSAWTDSRISSAGRSRSRATWPSTRSSPNRSPRPPRASATPSVNRQKIASLRVHGRDASAPGAVARHRGGRVASSRVASPVRVETRKAWA